MDFSYTERLAKLIQLKHDVLAQLWELSQRQSDAIANDDVDRLMSLLAQKQILLNQMKRVEVALEPYRQDDPECRAWPTAEARRRCQLIADRANALLTQLLTLEKQAEGQLVQSRDATAREVAAATSAFAARQAYVAAPVNARPGLDLLSET